jgi:hypothetical protein
MATRFVRLLQPRCTWAFRFVTSAVAFNGRSLFGNLALLGMTS